MTPIVESVRPPASERAALNIVTHLARWSARRGALATTVLVVLVTVAEAVTPPRIVVALLYLLPIGLAALGRGWRIGALVALLCTGLGVGADTLFRGHTDGVEVLAWNWSLRAGVFLSYAWVTGALRTRLKLETELARTDALTGVHNRLAFFELLSRELLRVARTSRPISLAYIDLDFFKKVNDTRGHDEGDRVLLAVATTLRSSLRKLDSAARIGGDEFAVLMPETDAEGAARAIERIRESWLTFATDHDWPVRMSIGLITLSEAKLTPDELLARADSLMYEVKQSGRNAVRAVNL